MISSTRKFGNLWFENVPFGLTHFPATFQKMMNEVLRGVDSSTVYLYDAIFFSKLDGKHFKEVCEVFKNMHQAGFRMKLKNLHSVTLKYIYSVILYQLKA